MRHLEHPDAFHHDTVMRCRVTNLADACFDEKFSALVTRSREPPAPTGGDPRDIQSRTTGPAVLHPAQSSLLGAERPVAAGHIRKVQRVVAAPVRSYGEDAPAFHDECPKIVFTVARIVYGEVRGTHNPLIRLLRRGQTQSYHAHYSTLPPDRTQPCLSHPRTCTTFAFPPNFTTLYPVPRKCRTGCPPGNVSQIRTSLSTR